MSNSFLPAKVFANAGLKLLKNNLVMAKLCDSEGVEKAFSPGAGGTVYVKRPPEFIVRDGAVASPQNTVEGEVAVNIDKQKGVDVQFTSQEETLNVDQLLRSRVLSAAMAQIASQIDSDLIGCIKEFPNWTGTPGVQCTSPTPLFAAAQRLDELAIPTDNRNGVLTPSDAYGVAGNLLTLAAQSGEVAQNALEKAKIPVIGNVDWFMTQTAPSLTTGTRVSSAASLVNGASAQDVAYTAVKSSYTQTLVIKSGGNAKTISVGEVFTIAGVNAVNPRTKADLGYLKQFTVIATAANPASYTTSAGGDVTVTISPPIIISGAYQNVTTPTPADGAAITYMGAAGTTYRPGAAFHKTAIKLVSAKLIMPYSGEADYATDPDTGLTIRYWRYSDGSNDLHNHRWDVLYGVVNADRRLGVRVSG